MNRSLAGLSLFVVVAGAGCLGSPDDEPLLGSAQASITVVPPMVSCIQIVAVGNRTITQSFSVTPGQSSVETMPDLPTGSVTFTASAYNQSCNAVNASSVPSWLSDPTVATLTAGHTANLSLTLRQNAAASVGVNFQTDGGAVVNPDGGITPPNLDAGLPHADLGHALDLSHASDLAIVHHGDGG